MRTLADRATHAASRMLEGYTTSASRIVPRDALAAVGTFDFGEGRITLTGADSEGAVAAWLGTLRLDPAELALGNEGVLRGGSISSRLDSGNACERILGNKRNRLAHGRLLRPTIKGCRWGRELQQKLGSGMRIVGALTALFAS